MNNHDIVVGQFRVVSTNWFRDYVIKTNNILFFILEKDESYVTIVVDNGIRTIETALVLRNSFVYSL